ncbi:Pleiotropic drug resistance protein [Phytophthora cinnamomi]|uniref:Pleiotropic drug resistance protein n=1 Tax=Phytophthora cinnamomi TaxID=4785 RepID=UPI003559C1B2|nr:Pleiotropic drug resistance protein [Phytophthora cinnamomi]
MVAPTPKTPRYELTEQERRLCREALLSERHGRRIRRAEQKEGNEGTNKKKKESRKKPAKHTTPAMEIAESKQGPAPVLDAGRASPAESKAAADDDASGAKETADDEVAVAPRQKKQTTGKDKKQTTGKKKTRSLRASTEAPAVVSAVAPALAEVTEVVAEMVTSVSGVDVSTPEASTSANSRKRRRSVLQCSGGEEEEREACAGGTAVPLPLTCVVDGDANLMPAGADQYTGLNSDEDPLLQEEPEDEDDLGDDDWVEDWDIGDLTDEDSDEEVVDIPESVCLSTARNKKTISEMRADGWEYDPAKFGPDPTYADLYSGVYGPSNSVMAVADDPLALLFYFMPPKLWTQIAVESNRYHKQSIPLRARSIRSQQRRNGLDVEDLDAIHQRLAAVPVIMPHEVLCVVALLIARMLTPIRKGIAAHWSTKQD